MNSTGVGCKIWIYAGRTYREQLHRDDPGFGHAPLPTPLPTRTLGVPDWVEFPGNRELFEAFRREVLSLDPCVSEEFIKLYVAYRAETNFVDLVPRPGGCGSASTWRSPRSTTRRGNART